jgi:hypothetical protein
MGRGAFIRCMGWQLTSLITEAQVAQSGLSLLACSSFRDLQRAGDLGKFGG